MKNTELMKIADQKLNRRTDSNGRLHGDVAAALIVKSGKVYTGVCVDTPSWGLCAERSALAAMITDGEYSFERIVAVWRDPDSEKLVVLPPCGHCRQFMRDIENSNLNSKIVLGTEKEKLLKELLPENEWPDFVEEKLIT